MFLVLVLISSMVTDSAWIFSLIRTLWIPMLDYRPYLFWLRISWGFYIIQYQAIALFLESLVAQSSQLKLRQKIFILISCGFVLFDLGIALLNFNCIQTSDRPPIEFFIRNLQNFYMLLVVMIPSLLLTIWKLRSTKLPRILRKQVKILLPAFIIPAWVSDLLQTFPLAFNPHWATNSYAAMCLSTLLITIAAFFCARKVITLRFLNLQSHVQSETKFNFVDGFKSVLEQLSHATNISELGHITQTLFKEAFGIPQVKTTLHIRKKSSTEHASEPFQQQNSLATTVENFMESNNGEVYEHIRSLKILIHDEIAFSSFYEKDAKYTMPLKFLEAINADIFLPIYEKQNMIAYIVVDRYAQPDKFYGDVERDEMIVFSSYLSNIINLLQNRNLEMLIHQEKELKEELYNKHQEINQYKESIRSFLRTNKQKEIGIIFYKSRRFVFANKAAKEMVPININTQNGHPLTKELKQLAHQVEEYKSPQTRFTVDTDGKKLVIAGVPNLEQNNVIITIYYPEISDLIKRQVDLLNDPTQWDFLLYLETTESGKLINQLIPSSGELMLNFKIALLKTALSKKAILLEMPEEDLGSIIEILHHISLRETIHTLKLQAPSTNNETAIKLFGISNVYGIALKTKPLLEQLNDSGTLFIQNIHFLDLETQEYLAEFIRYGLFRIFKSDQKIPSNVRIICSTNQNLQTRVHEGTFSKSLFNELKAMSLVMPSLLTLPEHELTTLADGFTEQAIKSNDLKSLLELSDRDHSKISHTRPMSLQELKGRIQQLLIKKSKENQIQNETHFDPGYQLSDPQLVEAARLGKHALRDPRLMNMLWNKFKSQSKIAEFLVVNRSSVNRRCKEFNLE